MCPPCPNNASYSILLAFRVKFTHSSSLKKPSLTAPPSSLLWFPFFWMLADYTPSYSWHSATALVSRICSVSQLLALPAHLSCAKHSAFLGLASLRGRPGKHSWQSLKGFSTQLLLTARRQTSLRPARLWSWWNRTTPMPLVHGRMSASIGMWWIGVHHRCYLGCHQVPS